MPIATAANIEKTFGQRVLFDRLNLNIYRGERIGLIGDNGSGKTSLLRMLTGELIPDAGTISLARGLKLGYLEQDPHFEPQQTVIDEAELAFAQLHELSHLLRDLEHQMAGLEGEALAKLLRQYQDVQHRFDLAGGYAWRHRLEATLQGVGLDPPCWEQQVQTLSGGQRSRLALAKVLIGEPDLLLLDEPTNHLDLSAIEWLERYLLNFSGAVVLISHDRFLLDRLATRIAWLRDAALESFRGNYSDFVSQRQLLELTRQRQYQRQQADIQKQEEYIRRFSAGQRARQARGRKTRLQRLLSSDQLVQRVAEDKKIHLALETDQRAGDQVLRASGLAKSYDGRCLWRDLELHIQRGQRLGILGPNGSGKTTLLEVLLGLRQADQGQVRWGANLNIGYYDQRLDDLDEDKTVLEELRADRVIQEQQLRDVLAMMLFRGQDVDKRVGLLSGGERSRLRLAQLLLDRPNVLVLDEPTNHLDIASREALEAALAGYGGTILCVSHDRYFLDRVVRRLLVLDPPGAHQFDGTYSQWTAKQQQAAEASAQAPVAIAAPAKRPSAPRKDNPYLRVFGRLSLEELEQRIHRAEEDIVRCQAALADAATYKDPALGRQLHQQYEQATDELRQLEEEYFAREP